MIAITVFFASVSTLVSTGCEKRVSTANIDAANRLREAAEKSGRSLTQKEVESVLGQPATVEQVTFKRPVTEIREIPGERHIYRQDGKEIILHFVNGKLEEKVPQFGEAAPNSPAEALAPNHGLPQKK